ncbi:MAG: protein phosphatase 2C domain-containing protein [Proteobacteria bacterium]|nr:protein phosphatase 2C domain-containing protein [Pseudomonadota bacterium]
MRHGALLGAECPRLGEVASIAEGSVAISLSRGGAPKPYDHTDPNEDTVAFAAGDCGVLLGVADGHWGESGSAAALAYLIEHCAPAWTGPEPPARDEDWLPVLWEAVAAANHAIFERAGKHNLAVARTTLALALVRPDQELFAHVSVGDSHIFHCDAQAARECSWRALGRGDAAYLGREVESAASLAPKGHAEVAPLRASRAIVLATDGLSEPGIGVDAPSATVAECLERANAERAPLRPLVACRELVDAALLAHRQHRAGDNVAAAVLWLEG